MLGPPSSMNRSAMAPPPFWPCGDKLPPRAGFSGDVSTTSKPSLWTWTITSRAKWTWSGRPTSRMRPITCSRVRPATEASLTFSTSQPTCTPLSNACEPPETRVTVAPRPPARCDETCSSWKPSCPLCVSGHSTTRAVSSAYSALAREGSAAVKLSPPSRSISPTAGAGAAVPAAEASPSRSPVPPASSPKSAQPSSAKAFVSRLASRMPLNNAERRQSGSTPSAIRSSGVSLAPQISAGEFKPRALKAPSVDSAS